MCSSDLQAAALAALADDGFVERTRAIMADGLRDVSAALDGMGLSYVPSVANFILVKVGNGRKVFEALQRRKVIARPVDVYQLPEYIRITIGTPEENRTMLAALREVMAGQECGV